MRPGAFVVALAALATMAMPVFAEDLEIPEDSFVVLDDLSLLPAEVRKTRDDLMAAAMSGDIETLGKIIAAQPMPVTVSYGDPEDKIAYLKGESRDGTGVAIMAILANLLDAPYAAMAGGDGKPVYVWPYLAVFEDLRVLDDKQLVDAYRIMGYETFEEYRQIGGWLYWRVYLGANGELQAFVAGD